MKILYAIQGTGNGHLSRARDIIPLLQKHHEVDILVSGSQADVGLPFPVKYKFKGLGFIFGAKGGVDIVETYRKNKIKKLLFEIYSLPVLNYDLVLNDFEPVSAWACKLRKVICISLSHQSAVLNSNFVRPQNADILGSIILKNYAPANARYGFHFKAVGANIFTPVIRSQVREQKVQNLGHYTVYLPAYDDQRIINILGKCTDTRWEVFSKHNKKVISENNYIIRPINNEAFIESMASSEGVLCGAGFETPAEALFMKKKLMVIPMQGQYEQQCNAAALKEMGVPVLKSLKLKQIDKIDHWIKTGVSIEVDYPDYTEEIVNKILTEQLPAYNLTPLQTESKLDSFKKFRSMLLRKMATQI
ncbi:MAG: glycosyltransferase family protein [Bacteroidota bacterium]